MSFPEFSDILALYDTAPPTEQQVIDSGHGEEDLRLALLCTWPHRKLVIKLACNGFTDIRRVTGWRDTIEAYRALGYDCPRIVSFADGTCARKIPFRGREWVVYAEEFAHGQISQREDGCDREAWACYHADAVRLLARVGAARLTTADFPSGTAILEPFSQEEEWDEIMDNALEFREIIREKYPQYQREFDEIWSLFEENKAKLERIYPDLPRSVFQADLNPSNLLLDENKRLQGIFDFNLTGYDTVLNAMMREFLTDFYEDVLAQATCKGPYSRTFLEEEVHDLATRSLMNNLHLASRDYPFSPEEIRAAPLVYRYLRAFWWQPVNCLRQAGEDTALVEKLLGWIRRELTRDYDFASAMQ